MRKIIRRIFRALASLLGICALCAASVFAYKMFFEKPAVVQLSLSEKVSRIGELAVLRYDYELSRYMESEPLKWYRVLPVSPLKDKVIVTFPGTIRLGIDMKEAEIEEPAPRAAPSPLESAIARIRGAPSGGGDEPAVVSVRIPRSKILSHEIDEQRAKDSVLYLQDFKGAEIRWNEFWASVDGIKKEFEQKAAEKGLFSEADDAAAEMLENFLRPLLGEGRILRIEFKE